MNTQQKITAGILSIILVVFPLLSWLNLQNGVNKRKEIKAELKNLGQLSDFNLINQHGEPITKAHFQGNISIVHFLSTQGKGVESSLANLKQLEQFNKIDSLRFWIVTTNPQVDSAKTLLQFAQNHGIKDFGKYNLLTGAPNEVKKFTDAYGFDSKLSLAEVSQFALLDTTCMIRNRYDGSKKEDLARLVRHAAFIYPLKKVEKPEVKHQPQK
jgi:cytochrome oxidase Cu insertion factor (SCO1/SenC/PrrC family)